MNINSRFLFFILIYSFIHLFIYSFIHLFIYSFIHWLIGSLAHWLIGSLDYSIFIYSSPESFFPHLQNTMISVGVARTGTGCMKKHGTFEFREYFLMLPSILTIKGSRPHFWNETYLKIPLIKNYTTIIGHSVPWTNTALRGYIPLVHFIPVFLRTVYKVKLHPFCKTMHIFILELYTLFYNCLLV